MKTPDGRGTPNRPVLIQEDAMPTGLVMPGPAQAAVRIGVTAPEVLSAIASGEPVSAPQDRSVWFCDWASASQVDQAKPRRRWKTLTIFGGIT